MPVTSPGHLRSPRKQALAMGTNSALFSDLGADYDANAGTPKSASGGHYQSQGPFVSPSGSPINTATPFALKGAK